MYTHTYIYIYIHTFLLNKSNHKITKSLDIYIYIYTYTYIISYVGTSLSPFFLQIIGQPHIYILSCPFCSSRCIHFVPRRLHNMPALDRMDRMPCHCMAFLLCRALACDALTCRGVVCPGMVCLACHGIP